MLAIPGQSGLAQHRPGTCSIPILPGDRNTHPVMPLTFLKQTMAGLPQGQRIYVIGDVHGMAMLLQDVFQRIDADLVERPVSDPREIILGDFIDRGPDSFNVIKTILSRQKSRNLVVLAGNHELAMLNAIVSEESFTQWLRYGGQETLMSYGVTPPPAADVAVAQREFRDRFLAVHNALPAQLSLSHRLGDFLFVHAGIRPGVPLDEQTPADLTSIRLDFLESQHPHGVIVVHGHTPVPQIDIRPNRINLDTCAYMTGNLTCLAIDRDGLSLI